MVRKSIGGRKWQRLGYIAYISIWIWTETTQEPFRNIFSTATKIVPLRSLHHEVWKDGRKSTKLRKDTGQTGHTTKGLFLIVY
jgi:hypothetical protein